MFNLPDHLLKHLFVEWIDIEDISILDRAICEKLKRYAYFEIIRGLTLFGLKTSFSLFPYFNDENRIVSTREIYNKNIVVYLEWLTKRCISIKKFVITKWSIIKKYYHRFHHLEHLVLDFYKYKGFDFELFDVILEHCKNLKQLSISNCLTFNEIDMEILIPDIKDIHSLSIENCPDFDSTALKCLYSINNKITCVRLILLDEIDFNGYCRFFKNFQQLESLTIAGSKVSRDILISISKYCKNLETLELSYNGEVNEEDLDIIKNGFFKLKTLIIDDCTKIYKSTETTENDEIELYNGLPMYESTLYEENEHDDDEHDDDENDDDENDICENNDNEDDVEDDESDDNDVDENDFCENNNKNE
jgi:hypothetical protein